MASVHEGGHAVGRIMTAPALGLEMENAVFEITIEEGKMPTTWGPWLSREMEDGKPGTLEDVRRLVKKLMPVVWMSRRGRLQRPFKP